MCSGYSSCNMFYAVNENNAVLKWNGFWAGLIHPHRKPYLNSALSDSAFESDSKATKTQSHISTWWVIIKIEWFGPVKRRLNMKGLILRGVWRQAFNLWAPFRSILKLEDRFHRSVLCQSVSESNQLFVGWFWHKASVAYALCRCLNWDWGGMAQLRKNKSDL